MFKTVLLLCGLCGFVNTNLTFIEYVVLVTTTDDYLFNNR